MEPNNKVLTISIGVNTLAFALENMPRQHSEPAYRSTDNDAFAVDVKTELQREEEDGKSPIHILFDNAMNSAIEHGSTFVEETISPTP